MASVDVDGVAGHAHARTGDEAGINCVADGDVGAAGPLRPHVSLGGEAGEEVGFGGGGGEEGALGYGFEDGLEGLVAGVEEEVDVGVDETRHQGCGAEVDDGLRPAGWETCSPTSVMRLPVTRTSPGEMSLPAATSSR